MAVTIRVPASSANLGPGFDALGLALGMYLTVDAEVAGATSIVATGLDAELCGKIENNLIFDTYSAILAANMREIVPLKLAVDNQIPLGKGCGSSAAAIVAGVVLANEIGELGWAEPQILNEISRIEGHPDNVCAAYLGGLVASAMDSEGVVSAIRVNSNADWKFLLAIPDSSLSTQKARGMLPTSYSKADAILNVQNTALVVGAFAEGRGDVLKRAMEDRFHQPYRLDACPLLQALLPLAGQNGILGVALSGAGPSVLLVVENQADTVVIFDNIKALGDQLRPELTILEVADGTVVKSK